MYFWLKKKTAKESKKKKGSFRYKFHPLVIHPTVIVNHAEREIHRLVSVWYVGACPMRIGYHQPSAPKRHQSTPVTNSV